MKVHDLKWEEVAMDDPKSIDYLIAVQEANRIGVPMVPPIRFSRIDWKPFIAAFHRLAAEAAPVWRARTLVLNGDLLLRLVGNEETLEQTISEEFARFMGPKHAHIMTMIIEAIDEMLASTRMGEVTKSSPGVGFMAAAVSSSKPFEEPDRDLASNNFWTVGVANKPQPSPTSLNPVFRVGDEVEWNVVGTRLDHGIIEEIDDVSKTASRIKLADGLWDWRPLSALRHRAKPAEPKFKNGDIVTGKAANTDHIVTGEINSAWDPPILVHGELQYCVKERSGDWWYCNEKDLKLVEPTKFKIASPIPAGGLKPGDKITIGRSGTVVPDTAFRPAMVPKLLRWSSYDDFQRWHLHC